MNSYLFLVQNFSLFYELIVQRHEFCHMTCRGKKFTVWSAECCHPLCGFSSFFFIFFFWLLILSLVNFETLCLCTGAVINWSFSMERKRLWQPSACVGITALQKDVNVFMASHSKVTVTVGHAHTFQISTTLLCRPVRINACRLFLLYVSYVCIKSSFSALHWAQLQAWTVWANQLLDAISHNALKSSGGIWQMRRLNTYKCVWDKNSPDELIQAPVRRD